MRHPDYQLIYRDDKPAFAVVDYEDFMELLRKLGEQEFGLPSEVARFRKTEHVSLLKAWRLYRQMTQAEVADLVGISQPAYAQMEKRDSLRKTTLKKLAEALDINVKQLME